MTGTTVMIIEDDPDLLPLLEYLFEREGYETAVFETGDAAWNALEDGALPDCILLDLLIPGVDGFELLKRQRNSEQHQSIPVVVLTDIESEQALTKAFDRGADDYVFKPFNSTELLLRVKRLLN